MAGPDEGGFIAGLRELRNLRAMITVLKTELAEKDAEIVRLKADTAWKDAEMERLQKGIAYFQTVWIGHVKGLVEARYAPLVGALRIAHSFALYPDCGSVEHKDCPCQQVEEILANLEVESASTG